MASLNKVILIGHLTADPELKQTQNGVSVTSFSIGVARRYKTGENTQSDFINIVAWRQNAEFICKYFKKGNAICICGSLQVRSYESKDGEKRTAAEVICDEATFVEKKNDRADDFSAGAFDGKAEPAPKFEEVAEDGDLPF